MRSLVRAVNLKVPLIQRMRGSSGYPIGTVGISIGGSGSSGYSVIPVSVGALVVIIVSMMDSRAQPIFIIL